MAIRSQAALNLTLVILFITLAFSTPPMTRADTNQPLTFSSGLTLYSPVNTVYYSRIVVCNGTFDCPQGVACSLNYSIDGVYQGGLQWSLDANSIANPYNYTIDGAFPLPTLNNGSHQLSIGITEFYYNGSGIYIYQPNKILYQTTWIDTIYFTISSSQPMPTSIPAPTPTPAPTISPTPTTKTNVSIPLALVSIIAVVLILMVVILSLLLYRRRRKTANLKS